VGTRRTAEGGEADGGRGEHDHEAEHADQGDPTDGSGHQHTDAGHETDARQDGSALGGAAQVGAAKGGGELGVLLDEGAFHLLERSQFFLGERHGNLPSQMTASRPV
jgi:hypothetical protein